MNSALNSKLVEGVDRAEDSATKDDAVFGIRPAVKDYAWGIRGHDSRVGRYALACGTITAIDPDAPYAELWIGTHPKGMTYLLSDRGETSLKDAIRTDLPFLFKILSAGKALSIQAHPDKSIAEQLNQRDPQNYGDANHKPEMAIALTPFEAMCGFRRIEEICLLLKKHTEFANCVSTEAKLAVFVAKDEQQVKVALRMMMHSFMNCDERIKSQNLNALLERLQTEQINIHAHPHDEPPWERKCSRAVLRLASQFPDDAGAMAPFFLNYLLIAPGESFFMAANEPHAYVAGEIIECMAMSDNVVRAGLTPKFKDVDTLVNMLTYSQGGPSIDAGYPLESDKRILRYTPPVPEFEVMILNCEPGDTINLPIAEHAVFIIVEGTGSFRCISDNSNDKNNNKNNNNNNSGTTTCLPGKCYYHPAGSPPLQFHCPKEKRGPLKVAIAHRNLHLNNPTTFNKRRGHGSPFVPIAELRTHIDEVPPTFDYEL